MKLFNIEVIALSLGLLISSPAMGMQSTKNMGSALITAAKENPVYAGMGLGVASLGIGAVYLHKKGKLNLTVNTVKETMRSDTGKRFQACGLGIARAAGTCILASYISRLGVGIERGPFEFVAAGLAGGVSGYLTGRVAAYCGSKLGFTREHQAIIPTAAAVTTILLAPTLFTKF